MGAKALRYDIRRDIIKCRALCICFKRLLVVDFQINKAVCLSLPGLSGEPGQRPYAL